MNTEPLHPVDCLMPAAGLSSRMGDWKMMLPLGKEGQTILDCSIANALTFCCQVILVTGYRGDELRQRYENNRRIRIVHNPNFHEGLFSSIQTGLRHVSSEYVFISHGDMPFINRIIFARLWEERRNDILFPANKGFTGHPVLLHESSFDPVLKSPSNGRMKNLLASLPHRLLELNCSEINFDIDTQDIYHQAAQSIALQ